MTRNSKNVPEDELAVKAPASIPDPFCEYRAIDLKPGDHPIWIEVSAPSTAAPGMYTGELSVSYGSKTTKLPVRMHLWNFTVPKERHRISSHRRARGVVFPPLAKAVKAVKKYAPGKLAYINMYPNYATLGAPDNSQMHTNSYQEYIDRFVAEIDPQFISYDNYMVQFSMDMQDSTRAANYYHNLLDIRRLCLKHDLPMWNTLTACQIRAHTPIPSPANLRLQAYTTLAAGSRG